MTPLVGTRMKRVEDPRLIQGTATYTDDVRLPGMLHVAVLRSPDSHARITRIDTAAAKAIEGVAAVLVGADVNQHCGLVPCGAPMPGMKPLLDMPIRNVPTMAAA